MKLDNNIYDNNTNEKEIFNGNFKELKDFMLNTFNFKLTDNEKMEDYEDFNGREFKIQIGIHIDPEFLKSLEAAASAEAKLEKIYDKVFGKFTIDKIVKMIKSRKILNFTEQFVAEIPKSFDNPYEANYFIFDSVEAFIDVVESQTYYKHLENGGIVKGQTTFKANVNFDDGVTTNDLNLTNGNIRNIRDLSSIFSLV